MRFFLSPLVDLNRIQTYYQAWCDEIGTFSSYLIRETLRQTKTRFWTQDIDLCSYTFVGGISWKLSIKCLLDASYSSHNRRGSRSDCSRRFKRRGFIQHTFHNAIWQIDHSCRCILTEWEADISNSFLFYHVDGDQQHSISLAWKNTHTSSRTSKTPVGFGVGS